MLNLSFRGEALSGDRSTVTGRETRKDGRKRLYILGPHGTVAVGMRPAGVKGSAVSWPGADQRSLLAPERVLGVGTPVAATTPHLR